MIDDLEALEIAGMNEDKAIRERNKKLKDHRSGTTDNSVFVPFPDLTPKELMALCVAQVPENRRADYFGMTEEDLRMRVEEDPELKRIWDAGPGKGKAQVQMVQYSVASAGDPATLKKFGEDHLGQLNKMTLELQHEVVQKFIATATAKIGQDKVDKKRKELREVIEAEFEEVEDDG